MPPRRHRHRVDSFWRNERTKYKTECLMFRCCLRVDDKNEQNILRSLCALSGVGMPGIPCLCIDCRSLAHTHTINNCVYVRFGLAPRHTGLAECWLLIAALIKPNHSRLLCYFALYFSLLRFPSSRNARAHRMKPRKFNFNYDWTGNAAAVCFFLFNFRFSLLFICFAAVASACNAHGKMSSHVRWRQSTASQHLSVLRNSIHILPS